MDQQADHELDGCTIFLFGATGDLARRKLYPALYSLYLEHKLTQFAVIGMARSPRSADEFREHVKQSVREFARYDVYTEALLEQFAVHFYYNALNIHDTAAFMDLNRQAEQLETEFQLNGNRLFYLALAPEMFGRVSHHLKEGGLLASDGWQRLVIEKPFGYDRQSAEELNQQLNDSFAEKDIYRIDHYLGKEMVQNIGVIRFANAFFEPLWNRHYISNVQITLSETVGVGDRGGYYDQAGALRDMGQNHMLQMIAMMAMEPPSRPGAEELRDEKVKVFRSLRLYETPQDIKEHVVRGAYGTGEVEGEEVPAYRDEERVPHDSRTETFFAAKVFVDNFRWAGVPFYVRTGKRLPLKTTEVVVEFKNMPDRVHFSRKHELEPNLLVFRVQPMEGVYIRFNAKKPGSESEIMTVPMDFCQSSQVGLNTPEAYERLLHDAIAGDSTYFTRWDELSLAWEFVDRIQEAWKQGEEDLRVYPAGSWGPAEADELLERSGHRWWPVHGQDEGEIKWSRPEL